MNLKIKQKLILKKACERSSPIQVHKQIRNAFGSTPPEPADTGLDMRYDPDVPERAIPVPSPITVPAPLDGVPVGEGFLPGQVLVEGAYRRRLS